MKSKLMKKITSICLSAAIMLGTAVPAMAASDESVKALTGTGLSRSGYTAKDFYNGSFLRGQNAAGISVGSSDGKKGFSVGVKTTKEFYTYTGKAIKPKIKIIVFDWSKEKNALKSKETALKQNKDYIVFYANNKNIGRGYYIVQFKTDTMDLKSMGELQSGFEIVPKKPVLKKVTSTKNSITVNWKKQKTAGGFTVVWHEKGTNKYYKQYVKGENKTSYTIKNLKKNKTYQVRVVAGQQNDLLSKPSSIKTVKTKK